MDAAVRLAPKDAQVRFARVANKKHNAGHYVNVIFESEPAALDQLKLD